MPRPKKNNAFGTDSFSLESAPVPRKMNKKERVLEAIAVAVGAGKRWDLPSVDFPIVPINEIAQIEGNAGKPIYQMSKWWARRRSSVFRSMLLAAATKAPDDEAEAAALIWKAYYGNHQHNAAFRELKVADIFMGGGTTLVEGSRLGFQLFGFDLNPVAWFVVKNELTPVNLDELKRLLAEIEAEVKPFVMPYFACDGPGGEKGTWFKKAGDAWHRLPHDFDIFTLPWQERPQYRYEGPEIIYTFWAKHGPCSAHGCGHRTPLLTTPVVAIKELTVPYWPDCECADCGGTFDIERFPARMAPDSALYIAPSERLHIVLDERGAYACPHCGKVFADRAARVTGESVALGGKAQKRKVSLTLLLHPQWLAGCGPADKDGKPFGGSATDDVESTLRWYRERAKTLRLLEVRGTLPEKVTCPETGVEFYTDERSGNRGGRGKFICREPSCGRHQPVLDSLESSGKAAPLSPYVIQGYSRAYDESGSLYGGRFFASATDTSRVNAATKEWESRKNADLAGCWPVSPIEFGHETHQRQNFRGHGYSHWWKMFNSLQLLVHSQFLKTLQSKASAGQQDSEWEVILGAFQQYLRNQSLFTIWNPQRDTPEPMFSNNNYHPKATTIENNVFNSLGRGNWSSSTEGVVEGMAWCKDTWEIASIAALRRAGIVEAEEAKGRGFKVPLPDACLHRTEVSCQSCTTLERFAAGTLDLVITDPPFGDLMQYSEFADFFYVWLRLALKEKYPREFGPEYSPKALEAVANKARQEDPDAFYQRILTDCWREAHRVLKPGGILSFTFHHSEDEPWVAVLESLFDAGFYLEATYPVRSDETKGEGEFGSKQIEYDIIHVCRKRTDDAQPVSWARLRRRIAADVQQLARVLTHHRAEGLPEADLNVIRKGKALEYYSKHYGQVYVEEGRLFSVKEAILAIKNLIDDEVTPAAETPPVMAEALTRQFLRLFLRTAEVPRNEMQKDLRGTGTGPDDFVKKGWCKEEKKIFQMVPPLQWAQQFKGVNRKVLSRDLDQTLFLIGACFPESGIRVADTLGSSTFRHHPAIPDLLEWFTRHGPDFTFKAAAARALTLYQDWMERNKPTVQAVQQEFDFDLAA